MFKAIRAIWKRITQSPPDTLPIKSDQKDSLIVTGIIGYNTPIQIITEIEVPSACRNCGSSWRQKLTNVYAVKNSIYMYDYCSKCKGMKAATLNDLNEIAVYLKDNSRK